jgi:hypothetical protein
MFFTKKIMTDCCAKLCSIISFLKKPKVHKSIVWIFSALVFAFCSYTVRRFSDYLPLDIHIIVECVFWSSICVLGFLLSTTSIAVRWRWVSIPFYLVGTVASVFAVTRTNFQFFAFLFVIVGYGIWRFFFEEVL